jgi:ABC-2 type transport system permease protein
MLSAAIQSEWLKTRKRPLTYWVFGIVLVSLLIYPPLMAGISEFFAVDTSQGLAIWAGPLPEEAQAVAQRTREAMTFPNIIPTALGSAASLGRLLMVILGAMLAASEFSWGTARHLIGRTRDRLSFIGSKQVVLVGLTVLLLIGGLVIGTLSGSAITPFVRDGISSDSITPGAFLQLPVALLLATLSVLPYALAAFTIALITRSTVAGVSIGLLTLLIGEPILAQLLASLPEPWNELIFATPLASNQILREWMGSIISGASVDHVVRAVAVLLAHALAWAGLALATFRRRELTA